MSRSTLCSTLLTLAALSGCDRDPFELGIYPEVTDAPGILDLGEIIPMSEDDWNNPQARIDATVYADVGATETGSNGGVTFIFKGTENPICVVMDPEAVFWNQSVAYNPNAAAAPYRWPDNYLDDGDLDMSVGFSSNYTGTPSVEIGSFEGEYTDSLGTTVSIEYNLCEMAGYFGDVPYHSGRATPEYCAIDTNGRAGIEYTTLLKTFSLPLDDDILSFAVVLVEVPSAADDPADACNDLGITECSLIGESPQRGFLDLEQAFCNEEMNTYCEENPDMCGDPD